MNDKPNSAVVDATGNLWVLSGAPLSTHRFPVASTTAEFGLSFTLIVETT